MPPGSRHLSVGRGGWLPQSGMFVKIIITPAQLPTGTLHTDDIKQTLISFADETGLPELNGTTDVSLAKQKVSTMLRVIGSSPEYQRC